MMKCHLRIHFILLVNILCLLESKKHEGDTCIDNFTSTGGFCVPVSKCPISRMDFKQNGIWPTFCEYSFMDTLVCCRNLSATFEGPQEQMKLGDMINPYVYGFPRISEHKNGHNSLDTFDEQSLETNEVSNEQLPINLNFKIQMGKFEFPSYESTTLQRTVSKRKSTTTTSFDEDKEEINNRYTVSNRHNSRRTRPSTRKHWRTTTTTVIPMNKGSVFPSMWDIPELTGRPFQPSYMNHFTPIWDKTTESPKQKKYESENAYAPYHFYEYKPSTQNTQSRTIFTTPFSNYEDYTTNIDRRFNGITTPFSNYDEYTTPPVISYDSSTRRYEDLSTRRRQRINPFFESTTKYKALRIISEPSTTRKPKKAKNKIAKQVTYDEDDYGSDVILRVHGIPSTTSAKQQNLIQLTSTTPNPTPQVVANNKLWYGVNGGNNMRKSTMSPKMSQPRKNKNNMMMNDNERISAKKCEEYSQSEVKTVNFVPLLPNENSESFVPSLKCPYGGVEVIVSGQTVTPGEFPHMAAIGWFDAKNSGGYVYKCAGSLISPKFVLTAGRCTRDPFDENPIPVVVSLGSHILNERQDSVAPKQFPIKLIHKHPLFKPPVKYNDIALIELASNVEFTQYIRPACLWQKQDFGGHRQVISTGWGFPYINQQRRDRKSIVMNELPFGKTMSLKKYALSLLLNGYCDILRRPYHDNTWQGFTDKQMCAGELVGGRDSCQADPGSPLQVTANNNNCKYYIVGITSFGKDCSKPDLPGVYTRVAKYLDWIEAVVWADYK